LFGIHGPGWHLDRRCFEDLLANTAIESGVDWNYASRITSFRWQNGHWELTVEQSGKKQDYEADFLVDATGRRASLARRLGAHRVHDDKLVGLASQLKPANGSGMMDTFTLVEAMPSGWWYSALLSNGQLMVVYLTDHDLPEFRLVRQFESWWEMLSQTRYTWSRVQEHGYQPYLPLRILPASSTRLTTIFGERWLAVGDAAAAYDPLSSHGITTAMGSGFYAALAIANLLDGRDEARFAYLSILEKTYAIYLEQQRDCYASEQRWSWHPFWRRRHTQATSK
jgi:flavin-dependent dehydrogenase